MAQPSKENDEVFSDIHPDFIENFRKIGVELDGSKKTISVKDSSNKEKVCLFFDFMVPLNFRVMFKLLKVVYPDIFKDITQYVNSYIEKSCDVYLKTLSFDVKDKKAIVVSGLDDSNENAHDSFFREADKGLDVEKDMSCRMAFRVTVSSKVYQIYQFVHIVYPGIKKEIQNGIVSIIKKSFTDNYDQLMVKVETISKQFNFKEGE